ncbi:MAG: poly-beta-1,6 N-acetyl-D-glucosamine synthase [Acetobacteraceae bacterium]|nr:poly-beta-1,6 N-acetyl-D-glucosamine synthase [Acetobacteraceae bacterium]
MPQDILLSIAQALPVLCFGYPFVMAWYWMAGGIIYHIVRERGLPPVDQPPHMPHWPPISIIVPCYNEGETAAETLGAAAAVDYPEFEIIAVNDGSRDNTAEVLEALARHIPNLRVIHMAANGGKATALNAGALLAKHELLVCIDGDALLDPHALRWIARNFRRADVGGITGNPRIRNRSSILGRLQVGEFSAIVGLIKRAQATYGRLFTVSGVICAFRKRALAEAGWWSSRTITDDIDITWRVQLAGWRVTYEPNAVAWILMPETLRGLWKQRLRWAEGGCQMMIDYFRPMLRRDAPSMIPVYLNFVVSVVWAYAMLLAIGLGLLVAAGVAPLPYLPGIGLVPKFYGLVLAFTYLLQAAVSLYVERRYERGLVRHFFWIIWYPLVFWLLQTLTTAVALPRALTRPRRATWTSPDRGIR